MRVLCQHTSHVAAPSAKARKLISSRTRAACNDVNVNVRIPGRLLPSLGLGALVFVQVR